MVLANTVTEIWDSVLSTLKPDMREETYDLWFRPIKALHFDNGIITLQVPNRFFADWVKDHYLGRIEEILSRLSLGSVTLNFSFSQELDPIIKRTEVEIPALPEIHKEFTTNDFNPKYSFESFVVGPSNRFAQAAAEAVAKD